MPNIIYPLFTFSIYIFISICTGINANSKILDYVTTCICCNALGEHFNSLFQLSKIARLLLEHCCFSSTSKEKLRGTRSGLCKDHSSSACKRQILFSNNVCKWVIVACAVWGLGSCNVLLEPQKSLLVWHGQWLRFSLIRINASLKHFLVTVTVLPLLSSNQGCGSRSTLKKEAGSRSKLGSI